MLDQLLAIGADVAVLRVAVLFFVFVLTYSLFSRIPAVAEKKLSVLLAIVVSLLAVLGFSDGVVVSIVAGYSAIGASLLFFLPILVLVAILFWKSDSLAVSIIKFIVSVIVLLFVEVLGTSLGSSGYAGQDIIGMVVFVIYVIMFFFGFDILSKLLFGQRQRS